MCKCFCFWGINHTISRTSGHLFFLALVTLLQGIYADVYSLPQECRCGSICKWLITGKEARWKGSSWWWGSFGHFWGVRAFMMILSLLITICLPFHNVDMKNSLEAWVGKISSPRARWSDWSFCVNSQVCKTLPVSLMDLLNGKGNQMLISQRCGGCSTNSALVELLTCGFVCLQNGNETL